MKKTSTLFVTAVAAVALFFTTNAQAQNQRMGIGVNLGIPTTTGYNFAFGADVRYQFDVDKQVSIPVTAGYTHFTAKESVANPNYGYIPVKAGVKYFFDPNGSGLYGLAEIGAGIGVTSGAKTGFLYSPAVGYSWSNGLDLGVKYEGVSRSGGTIGQVALRVAYGFGI